MEASLVLVPVVAVLVGALIWFTRRVESLRPPPALSEEDAWLARQRAEVSRDAEQVRERTLETLKRQELSLRGRRAAIRQEAETFGETFRRDSARLVQDLNRIERDMDAANASFRIRRINRGPFLQNIYFVATRLSMTVDGAQIDAQPGDRLELGTNDLWFHHRQDQTAVVITEALVIAMMDTGMLATTHGEAMRRSRSEILPGFESNTASWPGTSWVSVTRETSPAPPPRNTPAPAIRRGPTTTPKKTPEPEPEKPKESRAWYDHLMEDDDLDSV